MHRMKAAVLSAGVSIVGKAGRQRENRGKGRGQSDVEKPRTRLLAGEIRIGELHEEDGAQPLKHDEGGLAETVEVPGQTVGDREHDGEKAASTASNTAQ